MDGQSKQIHREKGPIEKDNERLVNQYFLGRLFPEFIPRILVPKPEDMKSFIGARSFPVEKIEGSRWLDVAEKNKSIKVHLEIMLEVLRQINKVLQETGVLLTDRNEKNILLSESSEITKINFDEKFWKVYQVDVANVYDAVKDQRNIDDQENLVLRREGWKPQNQAQLNALIGEEEIKIFRNFFGGTYEQLDKVEGVIEIFHDLPNIKSLDELINRLDVVKIN